MYPVEKRVLIDLGARLKVHRKQRNETQIRFSARIGIATPTYRKMEKGDPTVPIGYWIRTLSIFERLKDVDTVLPSSLFDEINQ